jgi:glycolate oxidase FAD binding subunit
MLAAVLGEAQHALPASAALEFHAHAASGIARLFARGDGPALLPWIEAVRSRAAACGGHAIVERTPETLLDRVDVWGPPSGAVTLARRIKETYDPKNILSPGRFADGI